MNTEQILGHLEEWENSAAEDGGIEHTGFICLNGEDIGRVWSRGSIDEFAFGLQRLARSNEDFEKALIKVSSSIATEMPIRKLYEKEAR